MTVCVCVCVLVARPLILIHYYCTEVTLYDEWCIVCRLFMEICEESPSSDTIIEFMGDGSWRPSTESTGYTCVPYFISLLYIYLTA